MSGDAKYVCFLDEETKKYAEEQLHETDETRTKALQEIKGWIKLHENLNCRNEDKYILSFLRGCKFNIEKTKMKLINFYTMKRDRPEWFSNRNPESKEIQELVDLGVFVPLKCTYENKMVVIIKTSAHNPRIHNIDDVLKTGKMILDIACMENEKAQIYGIIAIMDMTGLSFGHAKQLPPSVIKKAVYAWQNYHCRPKQLEFINAPIYVNVVLNVFKSFMSEKLKGRVRVHFKGVETLHNIVDKTVLPKEYGGNGESMEELVEYWKKKLGEYSEWFKEDDKYKADPPLE